MSDTPFQRPGSAPAAPDSADGPGPALPGPLEHGWSSGPPSVSPPPSAAHPDGTALSTAGPEAPPLVLTGAPDPEPAGRPPFALVGAAVAGLLAGGLLMFAIVGATNQPPAPIALTPDSFPREIMGMAREDITMRDRGHDTTLERLDRHFADQLEHHRFAYGGDGATLVYRDPGDGMLELTIVNGYLPADLPQTPLDGGDTWPRISHEEDGLRCTSVELGTTVYMDAEGGEVVFIQTDAADSERRTQLSHVACVLVDEDRGLSLRLRNQDFLTGKETSGIVEDFTAELRRIHADLVG